MSTQAAADVTASRSFSPALAATNDTAAPRTCLIPWLADLPIRAATEYDSLLPAGQRLLRQARAVRNSHDAGRIARYMQAQNPQQRDGFAAMLIAFSGLKPNDIGQFDVGNAALMRSFSLAVQAHQDWYESLTTRLTEKTSGVVTVVRARPEVQFSKKQLGSMRAAFLADDGLITNGKLLLSFPDRLERNEQVTRQYFDLSSGMTGIVDSDNASWSTVAVWASDFIGRNLAGSALTIVAETTGSNTRYWLSVGNSQLISDIGPGFQSFIATFGGGRNRELDFETYWANFVLAFSGRNISYIDGSGDPDFRMKNAFKAYYEAMQIHDQEKIEQDPALLAALSERRRQLMLLGNTMVALQEQTIIQTVLDNGMCMLGVVDPRGVDAFGVNYILPGADGTGELVLHTREDLANTPDRTNLDQPFTTVDGQTLPMDQYMRAVLNNLDGVPSTEDEYDPANSGTNHWEDYQQRMGYIFHLFSDYQRYAPALEDPRQVFGSRAQTLNNDPVIAIRQTQSSAGAATNP